jgi:hypothetical protein
MFVYVTWKGNELAKHRLIEGMHLLQLDDSCTDVFGELVADLENTIIIS